MSNEMIKRVAMAICEASAGESGRARDDLILDWRKYEPHARAAIEAMRPPTEAMIFRGELVSNGPMEGRKPGRILSAMIDAALQDSP
ncbi:hypothetical protein [Kaistia terrae]|uniref:Uncharacterized protein n=1 Tax=Kaistia terrae TaxID=537017 RepID=A0ABW0PQI4_9HYPH|nr:hypothetical protein [Kaistia terrae]MCX5578141.1 hypothetical protein [Kaistia terrae]